MRTSILRILAVVFAVLLGSAAPALASTFQYSTGTNGFTTTPFNLLTTELGNGSGLGNNNTVISSVNGGSSNGQFTQTDTGHAIWCEIYFISGGSFTPSAANPSISGWFIRKADNSHFEKLVSNTAPPRAPDFVIPLYPAAYAANDLSAAQGGGVRLPAETFEVLIENSAGVALAASGNIIGCGPYAIISQ